MKKCIVTVLLSGWMGLAASTQALVLWTEPWEDGESGSVNIDTDRSTEGEHRMTLGVDVPIRSSWSLCQVVPVNPTVATNGDTGKLTVTTNAVPPVRSRPADFGKHWVRTHPLTLAGWYSGDAFHYGNRMLFAKSGLNTVSDIFMPSALFPAAAAVNAEVKNLGRSLVYLQNSDVRFVPGGVNATPSGLQNWSVGAKTALIVALGRLRDREVVPLLGRILADARDLYPVYSVAAQALGRIGGPQARAALEPALNESEHNTHVRAQAARQTLEPERNK